jgi:hypothetical protein
MIITLPGLPAAAAQDAAGTARRRMIVVEALPRDGHKPLSQLQKRPLYSRGR